MSSRQVVRDAGALRLDGELGPAEHHPAAFLDAAVPGVAVGRRLPGDDLHGVVEADAAEAGAGDEARCRHRGGGSSTATVVSGTCAVPRPVGQRGPRPRRGEGAESWVTTKRAMTVDSRRPISVRTALVS